jgi:hypothetical protein
MDLLEIGVNVVDWIGLVQDRYRWRALVNSVMNLRVPQNAENYRVTAQLVASRAVLSSTELVIPEDSILHSQPFKIFKSYIALTDWSLADTCFL